MPTTEELVKKYMDYSDEELYDVYKNIDDYSPEAKTALDIVLKNKGGIDTISSRLEERSKKEIEELINEKLLEFEEVKEDKKVKPRTLTGSILGGLISGTIGGVILGGIQLIYSGRMPQDLTIGLALFCYFFIKFFTRQSYKNVLVLILTILSVGYALLLGNLLDSIIGYQGQ